MRAGDQLDANDQTREPFTPTAAGSLAFLFVFAATFCVFIQSSCASERKTLK
jgi:hypothetical protein